ncbi:hypothetical protein IMZ48_21255, partial [Candidatus Bathyarchaeota archaeon]|nr:hypothetical protein [Candidatus Bathyarchaeota archaeon]
MATKTPSSTDVQGKPSEFVDVQTEVGDEVPNEAGNGKVVSPDYSGAVEKSSVEEIKLVRKLDLRIMPTLWTMYFLNYVSRSPSIAKWIVL